MGGLWDAGAGGCRRACTSTTTLTNKVTHSDRSQHPTPKPPNTPTPTPTQNPKKQNSLFANFTRAVQFYLGAKLALVALFVALALPLSPIQIIVLELFMDVGGALWRVVYVCGLLYTLNQTIPTGIIHQQNTQTQNDNSLHHLHFRARGDRHPRWPPAPGSQGTLRWLFGCVGVVM